MNASLSVSPSGPHGDPPPARQFPKAAGNRLSIAHLLLWTAATSLVLAVLQANRPPNHVDLTDEWTHPGLEHLALQRHTISQGQHTSWLFFSPVYGASLAAAVFAVWRVGTRRFGFPTQPGHWLLLLVADLTLVAATDSLVLSATLEAIVGLTLLVALMALTIGAWIVVREPGRWRIAFALAAVGQIATWLMVLLGAMLESVLNPAPLMLGLAILGLGGAILAALASAALDLTSRDDRYDVLHWVGIGVLPALVLHVFVLWGIIAAVRT